MIELEETTAEVPMIDFGSKGKVLFQLPVLGAPGVPMGITSAFGIFYDKFQSGRALTDSTVASAWSFFITTLADSYPDATRRLATLDQAQFKQVITEWVKQSEAAGYSPKV